MKKQKIYLTVIGLVLMFLIIEAGLVVHSQIQGNERERQNKQQETPLVRKIRQNSDPIGAYNDQEPTDVKERDLLHRRKSKFNFNRRNLIEGGLERQIGEESAEILITSIPHWKMRAAFPLTQNTLVVIGNINSGRAFISEDRSSIYSEFSMNVLSLLKASPNNNINVGNNLTLIRLGGKIRLPSGKILYRGAYGISMPKVGERYLMFLQEDPETQAFNIITAYALQGGKVFPLDGEVNGEIQESYQEQYKFNGYDEQAFVNIVVEKIGEFVRGSQK